MKPSSAFYRHNSFAYFCMALLFAAVLHCKAGSPFPQERERLQTNRPRLLLMQESKDGFRSVDDLRKAIQYGHAGNLWEQIRKIADDAVGAEPLTAFTPLEGRSKEDIRQGNREYGITNAAGQRVLACALATLITGEEKYKRAALVQVASLFNTEEWPEWQDIYHRERHNLDADLRTGMLGRDLGLAYDWMYNSLTESERRWYIEGLDRCGIQPYLRAVAQNPWWLDRMNNWTTVIAGGMGILGMALEGEHDQAANLIELAVPRMKEYLSHYGPEGEFNENPAYASSTGIPVLFFSVYRYFLGETEVPEEITFLRKHCIWQIYTLIPPGVVVPLGDGGPDRPASYTTGYFPAVASAANDPVLQWFYLQHFEKGEARNPLLELLYYDATLEVKPPGIDEFPLGRAFPGHSGIISSRTSWDQKEAACAVISKAGHGGVNHTHPDAGQVIIQGYGKRLIRDLGVVMMYPMHNRRHYYHYNTGGHNVLTFNGRELTWNSNHRARIIYSDFDNITGGSWSVDLTELHEDAKQVRRSVFHLLPGIVAVLDEARFNIPGTIRVRWHPEIYAEPDKEGNFLINNDGVLLSGRIVSAGPERLSFSTGRHKYEPPYNSDRMGNIYPQRNEPFLDAATESDGCRILSLFAVYGKGQETGNWVEADNGWMIDTPEGRVLVQLTDAGLDVKYIDLTVQN